MGDTVKNEKEKGGWWFSDIVFVASSCCHPTAQSGGQQWFSALQLILTKVYQSMTIDIPCWFNFFFAKPSVGF